MLLERMLVTVILLITVEVYSLTGNEDISILNVSGGTDASSLMNYWRSSPSGLIAGRCGAGLIAGRCGAGLIAGRCGAGLIAEGYGGTHIAEGYGGRLIAGRYGGGLIVKR